MAGRKNRITSWIIFLVYIFVILTSAFFIFVNANHKCCDSNCHICIELEKCCDSLQAHGDHKAGNMIILFFIISAAVLAKEIVKTHFHHNTLISLKVELLS